MFAGYETAELDAAMEAERDVFVTRTVSYVQRQDVKVAQAARQAFEDALQGMQQKEAYENALRCNATVP